MQLLAALGGTRATIVSPLLSYEFACSISPPPCNCRFWTRSSEQCSSSSPSANRCPYMDVFDGRSSPFHSFSTRRSAQSSLLTPNRDDSRHLNSSTIRLHNNTDCTTVCDNTGGRAHLWGSRNSTDGFFFDRWPLWLKVTLARVQVVWRGWCALSDTGSSQG